MEILRPLLRTVLVGAFLIIQLPNPIYLHDPLCTTADRMPRPQQIHNLV